MTLHETRAALGHDGDADDLPPQRPPTSGGTSMRPAMIVLGLALLILAVFVTIGIVTSGSPTPVRTGTGPRPVQGSTLRAVPATSALSVIVSSGQPPTNIINAVDVPVGSVRVSSQDNSAGSGQYDSQITLRSDASQAALLGFYADDMKLQGWQIFDRGAAANNPGAVEVLGKLAGSDGYYWEMGAVVSPTTFGNGAPPSGQTLFTIRLFQVSDDT
jgi:hypothetical protein